MPANSPLRRSFDLAAWRPSPRALLWVLAAFVLGLLLFLLVWRGGRSEFYKAGPEAPMAANPRYAPLPAPMAGDSGNVSDLPPPSPPEDDAARPRLVETSPPPAPPAPPAAPPGPASVATSQPQPISTPAPRYPARALRRGERGTVLVSARINARGVPSSVEVARSSGSRLLDHAAVDAVRRWRFRPAMADGQPTTGLVQVPISFDQQGP